MFDKRILFILILFLIPLASAVEGDQITTGGAILNIGLLIVLTIFFIACIIGLKFSNKLWASIGLLGFAYLILMTIFFVAWAITDNFLETDTFLEGFFSIGFYALTIAFFPFIFGLIIWGIYMMITIKEIRTMIDKGIPEEEAYERKVRSGMRRKY